MTIHYGPTLEINLPGIVRNWQLLKQRFTGPDCAAVVKANAYGLGAEPVAAALRDAGCKTFFVATPDEAASLRQALPEVTIYVFHGVNGREAEHFLNLRLRPVLNDRTQLELWAQYGMGQPAALHVDTGMCRLGFDVTNAQGLQNDPLLKQCNIALVMSHLSCAGEPAHPVNAAQLAAFQSITTLLPEVPRSLCNSSGVFLDAPFHFQLARPGCALYGITPRGTHDNPMENVVRLTAPILQLRHIKKDEPVGYGATYTAKKGDRLATIEMGYADGFHRILTGHAFAYLNDIRVPIVGRVSMDMIMVDVSAVPEHFCQPGARIELIGPHQSVDVLADQAQTIGYEIFTRLGRRVLRLYGDDGQ